MHNIFIYTQKQCWILRIQEKRKWDLFDLRIVKDELEIKYKQKTYLIKQDKTVQIQNYCFLFQIEPIRFHVYKRERSMTFGRNIENTYSLNHPSISAVQLKIEENEIMDMNSTNGIYVNGNRIHTCQIKDFDQICFGNVILYLIDDFMIMNQRLDHELKVVSSKYLKKLKSHQIQLDVNQPLETIQIELPLFQEEVKKGKWFEAIGSSFLLMISSLGTIGIRYLIDPSDFAQLETMFMTSGSMCLAFLIYGLWNRNNTWKEAKELKKRKDDLYFDYLKEQNEQIEIMKNRLKNRDKDIERKCLSFSDETYGTQHDLWLGKRNQRLLEIKNRDIPYQHLKDPLSVEMKKVISEGNKEQNLNIFLNDFKSIWIQSNSIYSVLYLYLQSLWSKEDVL